HRAAVAILHAQVRTIPVLEVVADGGVVGDGVAGHMLQSSGAWYSTRTEADHHRKLALIVHELHILRTARAAAVAEERARAFEKHQGLLRRTEGQLARVLGVVQAQREDRSGLKGG